MTPIAKIYVPECNNTIYIKRDDLLPFSFGGNKVRIAQEFLENMKEMGANCLIGYGNARSNLSRAIANMCASQGVPCHIISPSDENGNRIETFNSFLSSKCGVIFHKCAKTYVAETVDTVMELCRHEGLNPYYIYGDRFGNGNEAVPVNAYVKAYSELQKQIKSLLINPSYLFLATGTGMTQSGLLMGKAFYSGKERIVGISVARSTEIELKVINTYLESYEKKYDLPHYDVHIEVVDDYRCGGYGIYNDDIATVIDRIFTNNGIPLDPTYTGKAFWGMLQYLQKYKIQNQEILFLHTGGTPLFFDYIKKSNKSVQIATSINFEKLTSFLKEVDQLLPTPLSLRVDLRKYAQKVIVNGNVLCVEKEGKVVSAILFYANDNKNQKAYLTLLATLSDYQHLGLGDTLFAKAETIARERGMRYFTLETDFCNTKAISFYARRGYQVEYADSKLHMIKEL